MFFRLSGKGFLGLNTSEFTGILQERCGLGWGRYEQNPFGQSVYL